MKTFLSVFTLPWLAFYNFLLNLLILLIATAVLVGDVTEPETYSGPMMSSVVADCTKASQSISVETIRAACDWWFSGRPKTFAILWTSLMGSAISLVLLVSVRRSKGI